MTKNSDQDAVVERIQACKNEHFNSKCSRAQTLPRQLINCATKAGSGVPFGVAPVTGTEAGRNREINLEGRGLLEL